MKIKNKITTQELSLLINDAYDAVERSKIGKITSDVPVSEKFPDGKCYNNLAFTTFQTVLNNILPKDIFGTMGINDQ